jgi:hypothetical protein
MATRDLTKNLDPEPGIPESSENSDVDVPDDLDGESAEALL